MTLQQATDLSNSLQSYVGQQCKNGLIAKVICPIPLGVTLEELRTFCNSYLLLKKDLAQTVKLTQTENATFEIGILTEEDPNATSIGISTFKTEFL